MPKDPGQRYRGGLHPFGYSDYRPSSPISKFAAGGKTAVVSTINGDSNVPFYKSWLTGSESDRCTGGGVLGGEEELRHRYQTAGRQPRGMELSPSIIRPTKPLSPIIARIAHKLPNADTVVTNDPMEATRVGLHGRRR